MLRRKLITGFDWIVAIGMCGFVGMLMLVDALLSLWEKRNIATGRAAREADGSARRDTLTSTPDDHEGNQCR